MSTVGSQPEVPGKEKGKNAERENPNRESGQQPDFEVTRLQAAQLGQQAWLRPNLFDKVHRLIRVFRHSFTNLSCRPRSVR